MNNTIEISGLSKNFGNFSLKDINFKLPEGYIMGLIGVNGAGKTSVIKLILNMLMKQKGEIKVFGLDYIQCEEEIKEKIGIVFDQPYYHEHWTLKQLEKAISVFYKTWNSQDYYRYLKKFGVNPKQRIQTLSKGMKMKLMITVALSHDTKLLILDEPTSGLDAVSRDELLDILRNYILAEDKSIIISSHITSDLEKIADYITLLHRGEIVYTGTKDGLLESYCIIKGDCKDLSLVQRGDIIGYREYLNCFEGLYPVNALKGISPSIIADVATLDDIILFTNREDTKQLWLSENIVELER